jgi:hypothetical protein
MADVGVVGVGTNCHRGSGYDAKIPSGSRSGAFLP